MRNRAESSGFTLVELLIAVFIAVLLVSTATISVQSLTAATLREGTSQVAGTVKSLYDRAAMLRRTERLALDLDHSQIFVEYTEDKYALAAEKQHGAVGESLEDRAEREQKERKAASSIFSTRGFGSSFGSDLEGELAEAGRAAAFSKEDDELGRQTDLPSGVRFRSVWTGHQEEPVTKGVAYLHFFPSGWTEPAIIALTDDDQTLWIDVAPLTGRTKIQDHAIDYRERLREEEEPR